MNITPTPYAQPQEPINLDMNSLPPLSQMIEWSKVDGTTGRKDIPVVISSGSEGIQDDLVDIWERDNAYVNMHKVELLTSNENDRKIVVSFSPRDDGYSRDVLMKMGSIFFGKDQSVGSVELIFKSDEIFKRVKQYIRDIEKNEIVLSLLALDEDYRMIIVPGRNIYPKPLKK